MAFYTHQIGIPSYHKQSGFFFSLRVGLFHAVYLIPLILKFEILKTSILLEFNTPINYALQTDETSHLTNFYSFSALQPIH